MGTPFAVTAANALMYHHERDIIELYAQHLTPYKRFIDDFYRFDFCHLGWDTGDSP